MKNKILQNNIVVLLIHIVFCVLTYYLIYALMQLQSPVLEYNLFYPMLILPPMLYILCGRLFLHNTKRIIGNILSVSILSMALHAIMFLQLFDYRIYYEILTWSNMPFASLFMFVSVRLPWRLEWLSMAIWALFPSVTLYLGLLSKKLTFKKRANLCSPKP